MASVRIGLRTSSLPPLPFPRIWTGRDQGASQADSCGCRGKRKYPRDSGEWATPMGQVGRAEFMKNVECQDKEFGVREFLDFLQSFCAFMNFYNEQASYLQSQKDF